MLPTPEIIETVAALIDRYDLKDVIVDPVMVATSGARLADSDIAEAFRKYLYTRATLITPNIPEAEALAGIVIHKETDFQKAADIMMEQGCRAVLIKGGHFAKDRSTDMLFGPQKGTSVAMSSERIESTNLHGTGCTFSSAIAAYMALGLDLTNAVKRAKRYIASAIKSGERINTGKGHGPVNHLFSPKPLVSLPNTPKYPKRET
jgi:hydroxymethylpyrimidine/phosphomethylpyrimidine kinase